MLRFFDVRIFFDVHECLELVNSFIYVYWGYVCKVKKNAALEMSFKGEVSDEGEKKPEDE